MEIYIFSPNPLYSSLHKEMYSRSVRMNGGGGLRERRGKGGGKDGGSGDKIEVSQGKALYRDRIL